MKEFIKNRKVRLTPVLLTALFALASLKAAGLWLNFSSAGAEEAVVAAPVVLTAPENAARPSETSERLLTHLAGRQQELDAREEELTTRETVLAAAELRVEAALRQLQEEKDALTLAKSDRARDRRDEIGVLSSAYERMKARDAARIFEVLDNDILIPVAAGMRTQALSGVLAEMAPEKAKALTIALANREADFSDPVEVERP